MPILTNEEADAFDEFLSKTTPKLHPRVQGPFIRRRETVVVFDTFSAEHLKAKRGVLRLPKQSPSSNGAEPPQNSKAICVANRPVSS